MKHELPKLPFAFDAMEPFLDAKTMEIHYTKHHQTYVDKLNAALEKHPELQNKPVEELLKHPNNIPDDIKTAVKNFGGGHANHTFYWSILAKDKKPNKTILDAINKDFSSFDKFKEQFTASATTLFGSGWTWLVKNKDKLEIINTQNQESPLAQGKTPLLVIDIWEHAYYLKFQNRRNEFIDAFFNVINWEKVSANLEHH
jgi:Fe-Mn family superoxide dismutase